MNSITVEMPYPGAVISCNHYLGRRKKHGGFYVREEAQAWKDELGWKIKSSHLEEWKQPLTVRCSGNFKDLRSTPDIHNLSKVILDAIQETSTVNDRYMKWECGTSTYGCADYPYPTLHITIRESE